MVMWCVQQKVRNENLAWVNTKNELKNGFQKQFVQGEQGQVKMTSVTLPAPKKFSTGPNNTYEVS